VIKCIHVSGGIIREDRQSYIDDPDKELAPVIVVYREGERPVKGVYVAWDGPSVMVYNPRHPLYGEGNVVVWVETIAEVEVDTGDEIVVLP